MRRRVFVTVAILLTLATGCRDPIQPPGGTLWTPPATPIAGERWTGQIDVDRDSGELSAPGFNDLIETAGPDWARDLRATATELLHLDAPVDGPAPEVYMVEGPHHVRPVITVTISQLGDDSIEARRYRLVFEVSSDGQHHFVSGKWSQRCHSGRGHRSFRSRLCS